MRPLLSFAPVLLALACASAPAPRPSLAERVDAVLARGAGPGRTVAVAFYDLGTGETLLREERVSLHAASTMKVPVMLALFAAADRGELRLDQPVPVRNQASARMVEILKAQELNEKIPAGLPPGTPVAHKTGDITAIHHDAAIVYPPGKPPYVLVVLTRGLEDEKEADRIIAEVSRAVWEGHPVLN